MKKLSILIALTITMAALAACGNNNAASDSGSASATVEANTPATKLAAAFKELASGKEMTTEEIAAELLNNEVITFGPASMPVEPGYLNGFTEEIDGFSEGTTFGPMIGSIPFVGYIFKVDGDVDSFISNLEEKADLRWNVCTEADEMVSEKSGDYVFFVMAPLSFEED